MSFKKHMTKINDLLSKNTDTKQLKAKDAKDYIQSKYPRLTCDDWSRYNNITRYRFSYERVKGGRWNIELQENAYGRFTLSFDTSLNYGESDLALITKESISTVIDHAITYLDKMEAKVNKAKKKENFVKLGRVGQIKKILKEYHPDLTFEENYGTYNFSNIHDGFHYTIPSSRVADREYRDDDEKMKPIYEWLATMATVKKRPKNDLINNHQSLSIHY